MHVENIEQLEVARREAMLGADLPVLSRLFADDLIWIHASSKSDTKCSLLEKFANGAIRCFRLDHSDVTSRSYGSVIIVQGKVEMDVAVEGLRRMSVNRYSGVWTSTLGVARLVLWQSTRIPD